MKKYEDMDLEEFERWLKDEYSEYRNEYSYYEVQDEWVQPMFERWSLELEANPSALEQGPFFLADEVGQYVASRIQAVEKLANKRKKQQLDNEFQTIDDLLSDISTVVRVETYLKRKRDSIGKGRFGPGEKKFINITLVCTFIAAFGFVVLPNFGIGNIESFGQLGDFLSIVAIFINAYALVLLSSSLNDDADHQLAMLLLDWRKDNS